MLLRRERVIAKKIIIENKDPLFSAPDAPESREEIRYAFNVAVDAEFMELLTEAKNIVGFLPAAEVLKRTLKEFVAKRRAPPRSAKPIEPAKRQTEVSPPKVPEISANVSNSKPQSRYIPKAVAYKVRARDQHQCTFISPSGRRCSEKCGLEIDHIKAFALGGSNEADNLRLLCPAHNQLHAETTFGRKKIENYFHR